MQFGITVSLQGYLKEEQPPYGAHDDLFFCWELHRILLKEKEALIMVNASNSFTIVMWDMIPWDWDRLLKVGLEGIMRGFMNAGYSGEQFERYINLSGGKPELTKTHGRRPVSALMRRTQLLEKIQLEIEAGKRFQTYCCDYVNQIPGSAAGFTISGKPMDFLDRDMERLGIFKEE